MRLKLLFRSPKKGKAPKLSAVAKDLKKKKWRFKDLTDFSVDMWEPSYDTELWKSAIELHIYVQKVGQGDGEKMEEMAPQMASILEWKSPGRRK